MSTTNVTRVATTITNVKEGTFGAQFPHQFAAYDLIYALTEQLQAIREEGRLSHQELHEMRTQLWAIRDAMWKPVDEEIDSRAAEANERLAKIRAAR